MSYNYGSQPPRGYYPSNVNGNPQSNFDQRSSLPVQQTGSAAAAGGQTIPFGQNSVNMQQRQQQTQQQMSNTSYQPGGAQTNQLAQNPRGLPQSIPQQQMRAQLSGQQQQIPGQQQMMPTSQRQQPSSQQFQQPSYSQPQSTLPQQQQQQQQQQQTRPNILPNTLPQAGINDNRNKGWADYFNSHSPSTGLPVPNQAIQNDIRPNVGIPQTMKQNPNLNTIPQSATQQLYVQQSLAQKSIASNVMLERSQSQHHPMTGQSMSSQRIESPPQNQMSQQAIVQQQHSLVSQVLGQHSQNLGTSHSIQQDRLVPHNSNNPQNPMTQGSYRAGQGFGSDIRPTSQGPSMQTQTYRPSVNQPLSDQYCGLGPSDQSLLQQGQYLGSSRENNMQLGTNPSYQRESANVRTQVTPAAYDPFVDMSSNSHTSYQDEMPMDRSYDSLPSRDQGSLYSYPSNPVQSNNVLPHGAGTYSEYATSTGSYANITGQKSLPQANTTQTYQQNFREESRFNSSTIPRPGDRMNERLQPSTYEPIASHTGQYNERLIQSDQRVSNFSDGPNGQSMQLNRPQSRYSATVDHVSSVGPFAPSDRYSATNNVNSYQLDSSLSNSNPKPTTYGIEQGAYQSNVKAQTQRESLSKPSIYQAKDSYAASDSYAVRHSVPDNAIVAVPSIAALTSNMEKPPTRRPDVAASRSAAGRGNSAPLSRERGSSPDHRGGRHSDEPSMSKYGPTGALASSSTTRTSSRHTSGKDDRRDDARSRPSNSSRTRSRSRSKSASKAHSSGPSTKRRASSRSRSPPPRTRSPPRKVESSSDLVKQLNCPLIARLMLRVARNTHSLLVQDLQSRFPELYIPADFIRIDMDWKSIQVADISGVLKDLAVPANIIMESQMAALPQDSSFAPYGPLLQPPKYSTDYPPHPMNNLHLSVFHQVMSYSHPEMLDFSVNSNEKNSNPIKFNARVIISIGCDTEGHLLKKLRILVGKKKGNLMLLGGSWCKELDGGNPFEDKTCLEKTARRAVLSQSLLDISDSHCTLTKLGEITYHRPEEDFKGKAYPEQDEVSVLYLCTVQNPDISDEQFARKWDLFVGRKDGMMVGPTLHLDDIDAKTQEFLSNPTKVNNDEVESCANNSQNLVCEELVSSEPPPNDSIMETVDITESIELDKDNSLKDLEGSIELISTEAKEDEFIAHSDEMGGDDADTEGRSVQFIKSLGDNPTFTVNESSALDLLLKILEESGVDDDDGQRKFMTRDRLLREIKVTRGETWTQAFKDECGSLPDFLKDHHEMLQFDGSKVYIHSDIFPRIKRVANDIFSSMVLTNVALSEDDAEDNESKPLTDSDNTMSPNKTEAKQDTIVSNNTVKAGLKEKPSTPCIFVCPQPIPKDHIKESVKKNEAITLRSQPLNSILTYSLEDSSERVFEASITAEMVKSAISVSYANTVTDFLLADYLTLQHLADPRIVYAVKTLRQIELKLKQAESDKAKSELVKLKAADGMKAADSDEHAEKKQKLDSSGDVAVDAAISGPSLESECKDDVTVITSDDAETKSPSVWAMSEADAKLWKKAFVTACRWFDIGQDHFFRMDQVQMIIQSSCRDITRSEVVALAKASCKDEKERLRYLSYILKAGY